MLPSSLLLVDFFLFGEVEVVKTKPQRNTHHVNSERDRDKLDVPTFREASSCSAHSPIWIQDSNNMHAMGGIRFVKVFIRRRHAAPRPQSTKLSFHGIGPQLERGV